MFKRLFDFLVAFVVLAFLFVPGLIIMVLLKCTGEHEVWYFQDRVGYKGKPFKVFKFATMRKNSEKLGTCDITLQNDPRVTTMGKILRKAKINELPQIINILIGDMSVVGWRPLLPKSFSYYPQEVQERIINAKPGLTGLGSIIFRDEEAITAMADKDPQLVYQEDISPYKGQVELWYQQRQSFWQDLKIMWFTAKVVIWPDSQLPFKIYPDLPKPTSPLLMKYIFGNKDDEPQVAAESRGDG